ncbi:MAG: hypothetical protein HKN35_04215 [Woeseia sp.]|nr:hypothetical protein [Woeseia sp.]MBT8098044.1 hypothetical protein [Woeseia sp.]NNE60073.1 hypothetical protein [Woeseia sp.]NNL54760.1 hypothetical protein [Woeseia sp.]
MTLILIFFGFLVIFVGGVMIVRPIIVADLLKNNTDKLALHVLGVVVRLLLGGLLLYFGNVSKFPHVMQVLGWISLAAGVVLALMGRQRFIRLMDWAMSLVDPYLRIAGVFAALFGAFLVYAFA